MNNYLRSSVYRNGHTGVSLILSSPFLALFLVLEMYVIGFIFVSLVVLFSGIPDIDIQLQEYEPVNMSGYPFYHWEWIPVLQLTNMIMNRAGSYIEKVPKNHKINKVSHRALTHSLWFAIAFGFFLAALTATGTLITMAVDLYFDTEIYSYVFDIMSVSPIYLIPLVFASGSLSVCFHAVGDVFTPTGIHFLTPRTDYGYTFDLFYANNEVANRSALPLGTVMVLYSVFFGYYFGSISIIYLIGGFVGLFVILVPLWILFIKTPAGKWFYEVYDHLN